MQHGRNFVKLNYLLKTFFGGLICETEVEAPFKVVKGSTSNDYKTNF